MTSALHRSKLFWFGLIGGIFLLWAWSDSRNRSASASWQGHQLGFSASSYASQLNLGQADGSMRIGNPGVRLYRNHTPNRHGWFKPIRFYEATVSGGTSRSAALPYWVLALLYAAAWGGAGFYRHRRRKLAFESHPISAS
ncbi:hypothetical protein OJ996_25045 [Luteolibacter sp. GHJ8]|uniref:DUF3592 domain-containing protein n=1 Tax=Luteolibacter rhizosphaerae TaxID=2989719 RepID=A0ABT3GCE0_9BACT|nr:hypothetical protein [Luteolibacter rhizosphaerae]MCW1916880.1 hypothetical protein [Luteolibacter rhizosphaerae]